MAEIDGPDLLVFTIFSSISLSFIAYHTYKVDGCRSLIPSRKEWFKTLLTWMLVLSNTCLVVWSAAWTHVKYSLGYIKFGAWGARSWPSALFPSPYDQYNRPLTILLSLCYALQASLTAEELFYWWYVMRVTRSPRTSQPFLKSKFFYAWIFVSIVIGTVQLAVPWVGNTEDLAIQLSKELLAGGLLELAVLCGSIVVVLKFPKFLREVQASGAGEDVRVRLYYYNDMNRLRTFARVLFTCPLVILGVDGLTTTSTINLNPVSANMLGTLTVGSLCLLMMISIMLYLPRPSPNSARQKVMVGQMPPTNQLTSAFQLMSVLREGGQWDGENDDLTSMHVRGPASDAPFAGATTAERGGSWGAGAEEKWSGRQNVESVPSFAYRCKHPSPTPTSGRDSDPGRT